MDDFLPVFQQTLRKNGVKGAVALCKDEKGARIVREAVRVDELRSYLHGPTLVRIWPELNLPRGVRAAWEARHPRLRRVAVS